MHQNCRKYKEENDLLQENLKATVEPKKLQLLGGEELQKTVLPAIAERLCSFAFYFYSLLLKRKMYFVLVVYKKIDE